MYSFGEEIKKVRMAKRMSLDEMAESLNSYAEKLNESGKEQFSTSINKSLISRWENGKTEPRMDTIRLLSKWSGVSVNKLLGFDTNETTANPAMETIAAHMADSEKKLTKSDIDKINDYIDLILDSKK